MAGIFRQKKGLAATTETKYLEKVGRLERVTNLLRKLKENPEPAHNIRIWKKIAKLDSFLYSGSHAPNEREWRTFFREFEANFISYRRSKDVVNLILAEPDMGPALFFKKLSEQNYSSEYIDFLRRQLELNETLDRLRVSLELEKESTLTHLGNHYHEYRMVRNHLEELVNKEECTENCQQYTRYLLGNLGAPSDKEQLMFKMFFDGPERPSIKEMRELLYLEQTFVLTRLKRERNAELIGFLKGIISQPEFIDTLLGYVYKSKLLEKRRAVKLFKMIYNAQAKRNHFPKINRVIYGPDQPAQSLDLLKNVNTSIEKDELLVSFARRVDAGAEKKWQSLLKEAQAKDADFHKRMLEAGEKAKVRGDLSPTSNRSYIGKLATLIVVGVPTIGYFYFDGLPTSVEEYMYGASEDQDIDINQPRPDSDLEIELDGEEEGALDEASSVITDDSEQDRAPSSLKRPIFSTWWCSQFECQK